MDKKYDISNSKIMRWTAHRRERWEHGWWQKQGQRTWICQVSEDRKK